MTVIRPDFGKFVTPISISTTNHGDDFHTEIDYPIEKLELLTGGGPLAQIFEFHRTLGGDAPRHWVPEQSCPALSHAIATSADVTQEDPLKYTVLRHSICPDTGFGAEWIGRTLGSFGKWQRHAVSCATAYLFCREDRKPKLSRVVQRTADMERDYLRLILPTTDKSGTVARVHVATQRLKPSTFVSAE